MLTYSHKLYLFGCPSVKSSSAVSQYVDSAAFFFRFFFFFFFHSLAHGEADDVRERVSVINSLDFKKCNDPAPRVVLPEFSCMQSVAVVSVQTIESFSIR